MANKEYKLNINPRILELLGPSLYTNIYYILAELIANAYDADAHNVYVIANKDDITVEDDGTGMSYQNGDIEHYLNVAKESRSSEEQALTKTCNRKKMGRKGVGKLAALSVSENVLVKTRRDGEVSGFILSRHVDADNRLTPIPDDEIVFQKITGNGSAIVMQNPQYRLHKSLDVIKKNLLKIFPLVCDDFQIHIIRGTEEVIVSDFDKNVMSELCSVITLGDDFSPLADLVLTDFERRDELVEKRGKKVLVPKKTMAGYILVKMMYGDDIWHAVTRTQYITGFVGPKGRPICITDEEARKMGVDGGNQNEAKMELEVNVGDMVEIIEGSLSSFVGTVKSVDKENQKVVCLVEMFGRESEIELAFNQIRLSNK